MVVKISPIIKSVISLFLMIMIGVYGHKRKIISSQMNTGLTDILIQIALPIMIVTSFIFTYDHTLKGNVIKTFYYSFIAYMVMILLSYLLLLPIGKDKKTILHFANVFPNTGYIGFPILMSIYGPEGVIYGSIFNMFFVIFLWTYGLMLFKSDFKKKTLKSEIKKILLNPSILAVIIGLIIMIFRIQLPSALLSSMNSVGSMTGPLSMIIIGGILSEAKIVHYLMDWTIYYGIIIKLLIIPLLIYILFLLTNHHSMAITTVILMTAMPASTMTSILAKKFNKKESYAAVLVSLSTILSLLTIPILLKIIT